MGRVTRLVSSILIVATIAGQSCSFGAVTRLVAASRRGGVIDAPPSTPAAEIATESMSCRVAAADRRADSNALAAAAARAAVLGLRGRSEVPLTVSVRRAYEPRAAHGRAPPLSC